MDHTFAGEIIEWRGPAPYYFLTVPPETGTALRAAASAGGGSWGTVPVRAVLGGTEWTTSLWSRDGDYLLPLKDAVRKPAGLDVGDTIEAHVTYHPRKRTTAPQANPAQPARARSTPAQSAPGRSAPGQSAPARSTPGQSAPTRSAPMRSAPARSAPGQSALGRSAPARPVRPVPRTGGSREPVKSGQLTIVPANRARWDDLEAIFGTTGDTSRCWCQRFRMLPKESWASEGPTELAARLRDQTACDNPRATTTTGLIAYLEDAAADPDAREPVGWCAVAPRAGHARLVRDYRVPWLGRNEDKTDASVWAVTCFVTRIGFRRRGISRLLAHAAVEFAREGGARAVEGYPDLVDGGSVGTLATFADAGFTVVSRPGNRRAVMRVDF